MAVGRISDEEIVYRRIPPVLPFFEEPGRITTQNFKLDRRRNELGLSVYRAAIVTAQDVLSRPDAIPDSKIAAARVGDIRQLVSGDGTPHGLDVIVVADEHNPGHAEIRGPETGKLKDGASKALQRIFQLI
jgi:hypothetical protein